LRNQEFLLSYYVHLREDQWLRIKDALPGKASDPGRTAQDNRRFVEAVMWVGKNGARWRSLPKEYGNWNSDPPALSSLVAPGNLADDFQHPGRQRRHRVAYDRFDDHPGSSTGRWRKRGQYLRA
jgi:transposase